MSFVSSERWVDGEVASFAEAARRKRSPVVSAEFEQAVNEAANEYHNTKTGAKYWHQQPVGGRIMQPPANMSASTRIAYRGANDETPIENIPTDVDFLRKRHVGTVATNSLVNDVVFSGGDKTVQAVEAKRAQLPQFSSAAGLSSSKFESNKIRVENNVLDKYNNVKSSTSIEEVVFGRDSSHQEMGDPLYQGSTGLRSSEANSRSGFAIAAFPENRSVLRRTAVPMSVAASGLDLSGDAAHEGMCAHSDFKDAAGALLNLHDRGSSIPKKMGRPPPPVLSASQDCRDDEFHKKRVPLLNEQYHLGSVSAVVFESDEKGRDATAFLHEPAFSGAAGICSEKYNHAASTDLVRRDNPIHKRTGPLHHATLDSNLFHGAAGNAAAAAADKCAAPAFASAAGVQAGHETTNKGPRNVPKPADHAVDLIPGQQREAEVSEQQRGYLQKTAGAAGQPSWQIDAQAFDSRLNVSGHLGRPERKQLRGEPPADVMRSSTCVAEVARGAEMGGQYAGACGASRGTLALEEGRAKFSVQGRDRSRPDLASAEIRESLFPELGTSAAGAAARMEAAGAAGVQMRSVNDLKSLLQRPQEPAEDKARMEKLRSSTAMSVVLGTAADGPNDSARSAAVRNRQKAGMRDLAEHDSISAGKILQPALNAPGPQTRNNTGHNNVSLVESRVFFDDGAQARHSYKTSAQAQQESATLVQRASAAGSRPRPAPIPDRVSAEGKPFGVEAGGGADRWVTSSGSCYGSWSPAAGSTSMATRIAHRRLNSARTASPRAQSTAMVPA